MIRRYALTAVLAVTVAAPAAATLVAASQTQTRRRAPTQEATGNLVEIKDDRFTGKRAVRMLPVKVVPDLEMSLSGELDLAPSRDPLYREMEDSSRAVTAEFTRSAEGGVRHRRGRVAVSR